MNTNYPKSLAILFFIC